MPKKLRNEKIRCRFFTWVIGLRLAMYYSDGRSDPANLGRHSLGTKDRDEALSRLHELDQAKAVERGLIQRPIGPPPATRGLSLEEGRLLYEAHLDRPGIAGGPCDKTKARYRAAFDKLLPFLEDRGVSHREQVDRKTVEAYLAHLQKEAYAEATMYLEGTLIKQVLKYLIAEKRLSDSCRLSVTLKKSLETSTHCYSQEEFQAMLALCSSNPKLCWLHCVIAGLGMTGLRIGELAALRWTDVDFANNIIHVTNDPSRPGEPAPKRRRTKTRRDRSLPIHPLLVSILKTIPRGVHDVVFCGPQGGKLDPDQVRTTFVRQVINPLKARFGSGFEAARLHSFRHFFCSWAASRGVAERALMTWLGHRDARMIARYFHLHDEESKTQMSKLKFTDGAPSDVAQEPPAA